MASKKCLIFTSSPQFDGEKFKLRLPKADYVICADGGYINAEKCGFGCDLLVGDRDSLGEIKVSCEEMRTSSVKDDTDLMLGIKKALEKGFDEIIIADTLVGRFEQVMANIQSLFFIASRGVKAKLISANSEVSFILSGEEREIGRKECKYFSLFAYGKTVKGITVTGAKYPLDNAVLTNDFPLGVSNEPVEDTKISIKEGAVLLIKTI